MESKIIKSRKISKGHAKGEIILTKEPISFLGGVDPETGNVIDSNHELHGRKISGKILFIPSGKGSTIWILRDISDVQEQNCTAGNNSH